VTAWEPEGASAAHVGDFDFEPARAVADAVLYEGYVLYPYRASAKKNHVRWQFGVLVPPAYAEAEPDEASWTQTECVVEPGDDTVLHARVRFLQLQAKRVEVRDGPGSDAFRVVDSLEAAGELHLTWDEAVDRDIDVSVPVSELWSGEERAIPFDVPGGLEVADLPPVGGSPARVTRERWPLRGTLVVGLEDLDSPYGIARLQVRIRNETPFDGAAGRDGALRGSLLSAHLLLGLHGGSFVSSLDPPEWSKPYVEGCTNVDAFPVLVGPDRRSDLMLSSRIVLYDRPQIAPESPGDLFDATEIDEILSLRTMALTDAEKREARATDPRAAEIIDRVDAMPQELLDRLHGAVRYVREAGGRTTATPWEAEIEPDTSGPRAAAPADPSTVPAWQEGVPWWDPGQDASVSPETDHVDVNGARVSRGSVVRLRPGVRRADAHDLFLQGRLAHVEAVLFDVDGSAHLAVTLLDDEAADLMQMHGRFLYFAPDEVEPVPDADVDTGRLEVTEARP
jgi:hypothetical protein